jgi:hypothetical protein
VKGKTVGEQVLHGRLDNGSHATLAPTKKQITFRQLTDQSDTIAQTESILSSFSLSLIPRCIGKRYRHKELLLQRETKASLIIGSSDIAHLQKTWEYAFF